MTENEKLRALLAEAQRRLYGERYRETWEGCECVDCALRARIDEALAESAPAPLTEWRELKTGVIEQYSLFVSGYELLVYRKGDLWHWKTIPTTAYGWDGYATSLEEGKTAALAAIGKVP
jgi:hypothetical protein